MPDTSCEGGQEGYVFAASRCKYTMMSKEMWVIAALRACTSTAGSLQYEESMRFIWVAWPRAVGWP